VNRLQLSTALPNRGLARSPAEIWNRKAVAKTEHQSQKPHPHDLLPLRAAHEKGRLNETALVNIVNQLALAKSVRDP
jgi:3-methyladenine DNA glycosylase AlkC